MTKMIRDLVNLVATARICTLERDVGSIIIKKKIAAAKQYFVRPRARIFHPG